MSFPLANSAGTRGDSRARLSGRAKLGSLRLPPDILEVEKAFFSGQPLNCPHRALGESPAGLGIVTQIDRVIGRIQHDLVHPDHVTFAERSDFHLYAGSVPDY